MLYPASLISGPATAPHGHGRGSRDCKLAAMFGAAVAPTALMAAVSRNVRIMAIDCHAAAEVGAALQPNTDSITQERRK